MIGVLQRVFGDMEHEPCELFKILPREKIDEIFKKSLTAGAELDYTFLGFESVYKAVSLFAPKNKVIIDCGCAYAFQSWYFRDYKRYIGIDNGVCAKDVLRTENSEFYFRSIQSFIKDVFPHLGYDLNDVFAICSYVPDEEARKMVRETFPHVWFIIHKPKTMRHERNIFRGGKSMKNFKKILSVALLICVIGSLSGCAALDSAINDLHGSLVGNSYTIDTYDNYGAKTLTTSGDKISINGNKTKTISYDSYGSKITRYDMASVITITIDGKEIESCGDTCIFVQDGLRAEVDFTEDEIRSQANDSFSNNTAVAEFVNRYKNLFGKSRVVVIKSQLGQPITAYSGDEVYWELPDDLPKMTKLMIDGKALYIHRANFQIIDKELLN